MGATLQRLYKAKDHAAFFVWDDTDDPPAGALVLADLRKQEVSVDPDWAERHRIPESQARPLAVAEMARMRESVGAGLRELADVARSIRQRTWDLEDTTRPEVLAARHQADKLDASDLTAAVGPQLQALGSALKALMDQDVDTPEGRARLLAVAEQVRDAGGPDWTEEPARIPERLRAAAADPTLLAKVRGLWDDVRQGPARGEPT